MIRNSFKIAWRNLMRNKVFSLINILGLAIGMTASFLIYQYVHTEFSYDRFHKNGKHIYRLATDLKLPAETIHEGAASSAMAFHLAQDFPEVTQFVRLSQISLLARIDDRKFQEPNTFFADSSLFTIFDFPLLSGDPNSALRDPFSMVISETAAKKYFGDEDPLGKTLYIMESAMPVQVTGVMADLPSNSSLKADIFLSFASYQQIFDPQVNNQWGNFTTASFLLLKDGADAQQLQEQLPAFLKRRLPQEIQQTEMDFTLALEPFENVYLRSDRIVNPGFESGNLNNVYIFSLVAVFILLIACINFINLTTARAAERGKEVGVRKVAGAYRAQLVNQFLGEAIAVSFIAFVIAFVLIEVSIPWFNQFAGKTAAFSFFNRPASLSVLALLTLAIGVLAGSYPAFVLSSFKPIKVLKGHVAPGGNGLWLRKALVVTQFAVSVTLIAVTFVVYHQLHYMRNHDLGFNKTQTLVVETRFDSKQETFKSSLSSIPAVQSATRSGNVPGGDNGRAYAELENHNGDMQTATVDLYNVDEDFIPQYDIQVLAGRAFSTAFTADSIHGAVLNERAVQLLGYSDPADAIDSRFRLGNGRDGRIIGVVKDFHFKSLQAQITPMAITLGQGNFSNYISIKVNTDNLPATMEAIAAKWQEIIPNRPFNYFFADEFFDRQYRAEERFGQLFFQFALLTIFISCLGLLALVSYSTLQRQKEIGVRKVLGASVANIVKLLSIDFVKLVLIAIVIATPIAWWAMNKWLADFAYRIDMEWWMFAAVGLAAVTIALLTVSWQAIRAALANPVESLRDE
ncbi:ABC transporter permease [Parapedobacter tibetensis]|uniref:ABC transporter permease n=1 Tax=Parapedobacter tibetensis TaxID=2972951 RepID=UPI00214DE35A|nr:ABC transporter permease [Parapedobacter tibetensis]